MVAKFNEGAAAAVADEAIESLQRSVALVPAAQVGGGGDSAAKPQGLCSVCVCVCGGGGGHPFQVSNSKSAAQQPLVRACSKQPSNELLQPCRFRVNWSTRAVLCRQRWASSKSRPSRPQHVSHIGPTRPTAPSAAPTVGGSVDSHLCQRSNLVMAISANGLI